MKWILFLLCLVLSASTSADERKPLELDVSGDITIDQQGAVHDYKINTPLAPEVKRLVDGAVRKWRFEPVVRDGKPVLAKTQMYLQLAATPVEAGYRLKIDKVQFDSSRSAAATRVLPEYPYEALRAKVGAEIALAVRIDPSGNVIDGAAVQSRLSDGKLSERKQVSMRERFEVVSLKAVKQWKFPPADVDAGDAAETTLVIRFVYCPPERCGAYGSWRPAQTANPTSPIPWLPADKQDFDVDDLQDGRAIALDSRIRLQTAVVGTTL